MPPRRCSTWPANEYPATGLVFVEANLFESEPEGQFDVIFFSFWLFRTFRRNGSIVFWDLVGRALTMEGRVFFVDNLPPVSATPEIEELRRQVQPMDLGNGVVIRRLNDSRKFRLVKVHYEPEKIQARLLKLGWDIQVRGTGQFFLYGLGYKNYDEREEMKWRPLCRENRN